VASPPASTGLVAETLPVELVVRLFEDWAEKAVEFAELSTVDRDEAEELRAVEDVDDDAIVDELVDGTIDEDELE
jgi:hypothetical protein